MCIISAFSVFFSVHASAGGSYIKIPEWTSYSCSTLRIFMYLPPSEFWESVGFGLSVATLQRWGAWTSLQSVCLRFRKLKACPPWTCFLKTRLLRHFSLSTCGSISRKMLRSHFFQKAGPRTRPPMKY